MARAPVRALLFDLGGVAIEVDFGRALRHWARFSALPADALGAAFRFDVPYEQHERGELDGPAYFASLRRSLQLDASDDDIRAGWNAILVGEIAPTVEAIHAIRGRIPCFAFTNSNAEHKVVWTARFPRAVAAFERIFVSSDLGSRKPEPAAFARVVAAMGVPAGSILFFDDHPANVAGALACGLQAILVRSPEDVLQALADL